MSDTPRQADEMDWADRGACLGEPPALFFPGQGEDASIAKGICARCPVREECLDYAMRHTERFGIWGGLSERERRRIRSQRARDRGAA